MSDNSTEMHKTKTMGTDQRFLAFSLGKEQYAVPLLQVKEVIGMIETTPMPYTPNYFRGIMNLRGQVISVIDLRLKFKMTKTSSEQETIIILDLAPLSLGIVVDSVDSVLALSSEDISPSPDVETNIKTDYLMGVARKDKRLILLLDIAKTLSVEDLKAMKQQQASKAA